MIRSKLVSIAKSLEEKGLIQEADNLKKIAGFEKPDWEKYPIAAETKLLRWIESHLNEKKVQYNVKTHFENILNSLERFKNYRERKTNVL